MAETRGAYTADRAAALAGVPVSTVHYWSRNGVLVPSLSPDRVKLWSFPDLMALRVIYWLRHRKPAGNGHEIKATTMPAVREALEALAELDLALWKDEQPTVGVDARGRVFIVGHGQWEEPTGSLVFKDTLDLLKPFNTEEAIGPDLRVPRPHLRIVPGKLGGAPHIEHTRIETEAIAALARRGISPSTIARLYPDAEPQAIGEAIELEQQLTTNVRVAA